MVPAFVTGPRTHEKDRLPGVGETTGSAPGAQRKDRLPRVGATPDRDDQPHRAAEGHSNGREPAADGAIEDAASGPDGCRKWTEREEQGNDEGAVSSTFDRPDVMAGLASLFEGLDTDCDGVLSREEVNPWMSCVRRPARAERIRRSGRGVPTSNFMPSMYHLDFVVL